MMIIYININVILINVNAKIDDFKNFAEGKN